VGTLFGRLEAAGVEQAGRKPPASLAAYECVLRGKTMPFGNLEAEAERRRLFEKAIELDPGYARAYALLGHAIYLEWFRDMTESDSALDRAFELAKKAIALDENDGICLDILAWIHLFRRSFDLAERSRRTPALASAIAFCNSTAHCTALTALPNSTSTPSPVTLKMRP
jgi:adenylate cyclase